MFRPHKVDDKAFRQIPFIMCFPPFYVLFLLSDTPPPPRNTQCTQCTTWNPLGNFFFSRSTSHSAQQYREPSPPIPFPLGIPFGRPKSTPKADIIWRDYHLTGFHTFCCRFSENFTAKCVVSMSNTIRIHGRRIFFVCVQHVLSPSIYNPKK